MSCFLLLILLSQIFEYSFEAEAISKQEKQSPWTQRSKIEITFKARPRISNNGIDHNVRSLFNDYAIRNGITLEDVNVHRIDDCSQLPSVLKYQANVMDCHEFQIYLYELRPEKYCTKIGHVKCDRMASTICLHYTCSDSDYKDVTSCT
ncbi:unnamed protein product [Cylicocyclus nassatus]|uniref:Uncharacterized protein n=1 Tax=Cylicocyclus nassatus TaxID=53992 RepID=A0AA36M3A1_CYLNA|nr:unnamed protein product [Cylicocyclus nassatus]